ncbi:MAG: Dyp-type peroxidase [Gammaproteobacteria bacterium]|nr:Dyp-type peroxidase [Gammaproteobacteria bacterium]MBU1554096.1 Dyp-type peroxidase [Gammaproteobacteria bacterium]MBU2068904.1 Dyp-type peroxidase [Gammaproteobacteria bacterium]MBU2181411.1 Dyp-type peroxidase [Gammaproteobacteria bacterium]MBU2203843.1 Dyp-type peroxidase [Gammaproteobacteria bacterium]
MAREQLGVCAEANLHGSYLLLNAHEGHERLLRSKLARLPLLFDRLAEHFSEAQLSGVVAIGSNYWDLLYPGARPVGLSMLPELSAADIELAAVPVDILIQIRSDRLDVNIISCQQVLQMLDSHVEIQDQLQGCRYLDGRNLTGFIDVPWNPKARNRRQVSLIDATEQPVFAGGSYMYLQQLVFDHVSWHQLSLAEQEDIMGYDKVSARPLEENRILPDSHRLMMQPDLNAPEVLMQNMPSYQVKQQGLIQLAYAASAQALHRQLSYRCGMSADSRGHDLLLNYHRIELTAAFFAPSISFLELSAKN